MKATLCPEGDSLSNCAGGKTNNINGLITNGGGAVFTNSGTMDNDADSNFVLGDFAKLINNGVLHQRRVFQPIQPERRHRRPEARDTG